MMYLLSMIGTHTLYPVSVLFLSLLCGLPDRGAAQEPPRLKPVAMMGESRAGHTATLLSDGRVLIAGGFKKTPNGIDQIYFRSAEIFDPRTGKFSPTGDMTYTRAGQTATLLMNGLVLVATGFGEMGTLSSAELFDPASQTFTPIGNMAARRGGCTATLLLDGRVLFAGGGDREATASAELYDPLTKRFLPTGSMTMPRNGHTATRLPGGMVLIAGGSARREAVLPGAEIYDPAAGVFMQTGGMAAPRYKHAAVAMNDGDVLLFGGSDGTDWRGQLATVERYRIVSGNFIRTSDLRRARFKLPEAVVGFPEGDFLIAGGNAAIELYAPDTSRTVCTLDNSYYFATATGLPGGSVLIVGGYDDKLRSTNKAWIWKRLREE